MDFIVRIFSEAWHILLDSALYVLFGMLVAGLVKVFLSPHAVVRHFCKGRVLSVFKAALLGIPLPLCSCGVLPAAASLKKQGANNGATTSFLISTPESGVDSIAITYALMDPVMTIARPVSAMATAVTAGVVENLTGPEPDCDNLQADLTCPVDACCDGLDCPPEVHAHHHSLGEKIMAGQRYAFFDLWAELAGWFLVGILLAGVITALIPPDFFTGFLGGGFLSMLLMLGVGIPLYICATASTPIAAALVLKGVSPGTALVFLLAGPATNVTSLTVLTGVLGKKATAIYLSSIAVMSVVCGLLLDWVYIGLGLSAAALVGTAAEVAPPWLQWLSALALIAISVGPITRILAARLGLAKGVAKHDDSPEGAPAPDGCAGPT